MRSRFGNPPIRSDDLLLKMEAQSLTETAGALRSHVERL